MGNIFAKTFVSELSGASAIKGATNSNKKMARHATRSIARFTKNTIKTVIKRMKTK